MQRHSKPKVAHLTSVHPASDTRIAYRECATLAQAGYDVVLIAAGGLAEVPAGVRLHTVPLPRNRFERMTRTIWNVFRAALAERADVYHFHDPELMGVGLALRALGARVVFDVHEDIPQDIIDKPWILPALRRPVSRASEFMLRTLQRCYSAIVAATPAIARRFANRRTIVVANYPRIEELPQAAGEQFSDRGRGVVYLGAITELRCIQEIVSAFSSEKLSPDIRLRLAGHFENELLEQRVRSMPGWGRVEFLGFCRRSEVSGVLGSVRAGLLLFRQAANHEEAMPTKLFEYLGAGLPVIISDTLQCSSIIRENRCGVVVDPADRDAIARAITWIVENPETAQAMGERGRRLVRERYLWSSEANKLTRLYAEIA